MFHVMNHSVQFEEEFGEEYFSSDDGIDVEQYEDIHPNQLVQMPDQDFLDFTFDAGEPFDALLDFQNDLGKWDNVCFQPVSLPLTQKILTFTSILECLFDKKNYYFLSNHPKSLPHFCFHLHSIENKSLFQEISLYLMI